MDKQYSSSSSGKKAESLTHLGKSQKGKGEDRRSKRNAPMVVSTGKGLCHKLKIEPPCTEHAVAVKPKKSNPFSYDLKSYQLNFDAEEPSHGVSSTFARPSSTDET